MIKFDHKSGEYFRVNDVKIYVECHGNSDKPVLLLLHGGFESIENMSLFAQVFSGDFYIIGIDSRGHGKSAIGDGTLTYQQLQYDVESILAQLNIDTVNIIGFSDGGIVGYRLASAKNIKVEKLVAIGASWQNKDITDSGEALKSITVENVNEFFPANMNRYKQLNPEANIESFVKSVITMWLDTSETGYPNERVKAIESDTLLIRGDSDFLVSLKSLNELQERIANSSLLNVPFAEHVVHEEQPLIVETVIRQFLTG